MKVWGAIAVVFGILVVSAAYWGHTHQEADDPALEHETAVLMSETEAFIKKHETSGDGGKNKAFKAFAENRLVIAEFATLDTIRNEQLHQLDAISLAPDKKHALQKVVNDILDSTAVHKAYLEALYARMSREDLEELNTIYSNDLVREGMEEMQEIRTPAGQKEMGAYLQDLQKNGLSEGRKNLLSKLDEAMGTSKNSATIVNSVMSISRTVALGAAMEDPAKREAMETERKTLEDAMTAKVKEGVMFTLANAYRTHGDAQLSEVIDLRSKAVAMAETKIRLDTLAQHLSSEKTRLALETLMKLNPN